MDKTTTCEPSDVIEITPKRVSGAKLASELAAIPARWAIGDGVISVLYPFNPARLDAYEHITLSESDKERVTVIVAAHVPDPAPQGLEAMLDDVREMVGQYRVKRSSDP